ncbi:MULTISPECIES: Gfo/Idh/MocA family oxidoreductase [Hyphomicrobiales]|uniref:Gfo/Idh/MocA family protein n=1 Tax=Hyphomicrobiales TaxID=356 RepID=UPI00035D7AA6|nr:MULTISPECIES: Gfo/Idh/MocA family oxidoreductase [Phyllobacteriaceae]MCX8571952.1 Gfo/Idh/MocA family oxidoreductase [Aminobacter sp. MET-1]
MSGTPGEDAYALKSAETRLVEAPDLAYRPPRPKTYAPRIALVGAGGISFAHLDAYRKAGFDVAVICNRTLSKAADRRDEFFPEASITDDLANVLSRDDIEVVDITTHPAERENMIERALRAGKHVLSQKPYVLDLDTGERLADLADRQGVKLAINQNGRWAPHLAWMREAVRTGLIGELVSCHVSIHWNHGWIKGTPFDKIDDLVLYDFGVHWFDFLASLIGNRATSVHATRARAAGQEARPPLLAQALVEFPGGQASLVFDGATAFGPQDRTYISGTLGSLSSIGPDLGSQSVELTTVAGSARPSLEGSWFNDGFGGTMGELLASIEEEREPLNGARGNLQSLALTFAAIASMHRNAAMVPGTVRSLTEARRPAA